MLISPCTLRSTQCATLIALAAAAGIARFGEASRANSDSSSLSKSQSEEQVQTATPRLSFFEFTNGGMAPWVRQMASFAAWFISGSREHSHPARAVVSDEAGADSDFGEIADIPAKVPARLEASASYPVEFQVGPCTRTHALPFAVGPPRGSASSNPNANGTLVPRDLIANGKPVAVVAERFQFSFDARLARLIFPGFDFQDAFWKSRFAMCGVLDLHLTADVTRAAACALHGFTAPVGISPQDDVRSILNAHSSLT